MFWLLSLLWPKFRPSFVGLAKVMGLFGSRSLHKLAKAANQEFPVLLFAVCVQVICKTASITFSLLNAACWFQTESWSHLSVRKKSLAAALLLPVSEHELNNTKSVASGGYTRTVRKPFLSGGDVIHCLALKRFFTIRWSWTIVVQREQQGYFKITKVIYQQFEELLTTVAWHKSELLQQQVFPQV